MARTSLVLALAGITAAGSVARADDETFAPAPAEARPRIAARRAVTPPVLDGKLDDPAWAFPATAGFVQYDPEQGAGSKFPTEVRVAFDDDAIYVGVRCHDPAGLAGTRVPDLRRDFDFFANDLFGVVLDPFQSGRDAVVFQVNPYGALRDLQSLNDARYDRDWDAIWDARTTRDDGGWTAELAIPWRTLRYAPGSRTWGINFVRVVRRVQEFSTWAAIPRAYTAYRMQYAGFLDDIAPPPPARNLVLRPFLLGRVERTRDATGAAIEPALTAGLDLKWALSSRAFLDLTLNTDFAQADVDRAIVNLTRYDVLFPERRPFFLENASLFTMGNDDSLLPFSTRRIGLDDEGRPVPMLGGVRVVARDAGFAIGALAAATDRTEHQRAAQFAVVRGTVAASETLELGGAVVARHDGDRAADGWNVVPVADFVYRDGAAFVRGMASASLTPSLGGAAYLYGSWTTNRLYAGYFGSVPSRGYVASAGFVSAPETFLHSPAIGLDLRPSWRPSWIRRFNPGVVTYFYQRTTDLVVQDAYITARVVSAELNNGGQLLLAFTPERHRVDAPLEVVEGVTVGAGDYVNPRWRAKLATDESQWWSASLEVNHGGWYDGRLTTLKVTAGLRPVPQLAAAASYERDGLRDVGGVARHVTHLASGELRLAWSPRLQLVALAQRATEGGLAAHNLRLSWEPRPLSFLYLVYDDVTQRDDDAVSRRTWRLTAKLAWSFPL